MNYQELAAQLIFTIQGEHPGIQINIQNHLIGSNVVPTPDESGYQAWLTYRQPNEPLIVETPALRSDGKYWHRLAVGQDMLIHWRVPSQADTGEVFAYYAPSPIDLQTRYYIAGWKWGQSQKRMTHDEGYFDRWMKDYDIPGTVEARNGVSINVTAMPARFAIVLKYLHHNPFAPGQDHGSKGMMGLEGLNMRGASGGKMLGKVQTTQGTAQYRPVQRVLYVEAYPVNNVVPR